MCLPVGIITIPKYTKNKANRKQFVVRLGSTHTEAAVRVFFTLSSL